jgi:hypothetical protein
MLFVVHLEVLLKGIVQNILKSSLMVIIAFNFCQSVLENTLNFMTPEFDHLLFSVIEVLLCFE